ncbi:hypothetical protein HQ865_15305 [Mucilaginibacter mali]|uniref:Peptidase S74 domain-containing protein n=1 Tax=Mucilaginibacter mali TaxID=2740462 RepID=A0A7D4PVI5_9SPHI|nr:hypothetical protein [Mucilaginibacter mali]QKJ31063.1 hypothetical protein HQ865_15305 [Mucilaginibacter mali]
MKKALTAGIALLSTIPFISKAQTWSGSTPGNIYYNSGFVGVGASSPRTMLEVAPPSGNKPAAIFRLYGNTSWGHVLTLSTDGAYGNDDARMLFSYRGGNKQWAIGGYTNSNRFGIWEDSGDGIFGSGGFGTERLTVAAGGNIGIGTSTPQSALDLGDGTNGRSIVWSGGGGNWYSSIGTSYSSGATNVLNGLKLNTTADQTLSSYTGYVAASGTRWDLLSGDISFFNAPPASQTANTVFNYAANTKMIVKSSGNVGIGTLSPAGTLQVKQSSYDLLTGTYTLDIGLGGTSAGWARAFRVVNSSNSDGKDGGAFGAVGSGTAPNYVYMSIPTADATGYDSQKIIALDNSGNVGIGTTNPQGYKLAVKGSLIAEEIKVKLSSSWPDYVFKPSYKLPTLAEVKTYIDKNQHLPDVPSADDVAKNGLDVGEMNKLLMKKVEELTLYLIGQDKAKQDQQKEIDLLKQQLTNLTKIVNQIQQH